jgi:hypothetical protein
MLVCPQLPETVHPLLDAVQDAPVPPCRQLQFVTHWQYQHGPARIVEVGVASPTARTTRAEDRMDLCIGVPSLG